MKVLSTRLSFLTILMVGILFSCSVEAQAYYNRGKVSLSLGSKDVSLETGNTATVSVTMKPKSRTGNQGCGMAKCPQECGGLCGDEKTGECKCIGDIVITKKAIATVVSSNSFVAKVTYNKNTNVITITGLNPGTTAIKVTGTLWQYTDSDSQNIKVTVKKCDTKPSPETNTSTNSSKPSGDTATRSITSISNPANVKKDTDNKNIKTISEKDTKEKEKKNEVPEPEEKKDSNEPVSIDGKLGNFTILPLINGKTGKTQFEKIIGKNQTITFEKKNESQNVMYSWSFKGSDIKTPQDIDMRIDFSEISTIDSKIHNKLKNPFLISFNHRGNLPGKATLYTNIGTKYSNGTKLSLYYFNEKTNELELINNNISVNGGYVSFVIDHCSKYILAEGIDESSSSFNYNYIIYGAGILVVIGTIIIFIFKRKKLQ